MPRTTPVVANANFWRQVNKTETCWLWTGNCSRMGGRFGTGGYGRFSSAQAHRVAYEALVGPIPDELTLDHLCRVPACVRPEHLEPVTMAENFRRYLATVTHCKRGHEFSVENTRVRTRDGRRQRICRACERERQREHALRRRQAPA